MANRRKFLAGMGALATGSAAAMGTGAFTSVRAGRTIAIKSVGDSQSLLNFQHGGLENSEYVSTNNGTVSVELNSENPTSNRAQGVNKNGITRILDLFKVRNLGENNVFVYANALGDEDFFVDPQASNRPDDTDDDYGTGEPNNPSQIADEISLSGRRSVDGGNFPEDTLKGYNKGSFILEPGQHFNFGLYIKDEGGAGDSVNDEIKINAVSKSMYEDFGSSD